jgi:signal transduction histidine kinase
VSVDVDRDGGWVRVVVRDDGTATTPDTAAGFGLLGMTERTTLLGGSLRAGPAGEGGWAVEATLPTRGPAPARSHAARGPA